MTSKTSFFNSLREDLRHRIWVPALACVVFLLGLIFSTLAIQSFSLTRLNEPESYQVARLLENIGNMYGYRNFALTLVAFTGAVICGLQGFSYLTNKCRLDFYHSLPLKRDELFVIRWFNGILFYAVPCLVFSVLSCIVLAAFGFMSTTVLSAVCCGFLHNLLIFLLVYHSAILACMITGNVLVAIAALGTFFIYAFSITQLMPAFMNVYYTTYANFNSGLVYYLNYLSPGWLIFKLYDNPTVSLYLFTVIFTIVLLALDLVLYRLRASEATGKAIAFPKLRPVFRVLIVVPVSLYTGLVFGQVAPDAEPFWSIFGLLVFLILAHAILEVIFDFDVHSAFHHKKELIACAVFSVAFMTVFLTDVLKLDEQIPSQHSVEAVYMDLPIDNDLNYCDMKTGNYISITDYRENHAVLSGDDLDKAYALLAFRGNENIYENNDRHVMNLNVRFVKNSGQSEYRRFYMVLEDAEDALADVFNCTSYKQGHYEIFSSACSDAFTGLTVTDATDSMMVRTTTNTNLFTTKETQEFVDVLRKDLSAFTYEQLTSEVPVGMVSLAAEDTGAFLQFYIYPSFSESIRWMKEHGIDFDAWKQRKAVYMTITSLNDQDYGEEYDDDDDDEYSMDESYASATATPVMEADASDNNTTVIYDSETIASIYPYLYNMTYTSRTEFTRVYADANTHNGEVTIHWEEDNVYSPECTFAVSKECDLSKYLTK